MPFPLIAMTAAYGDITLYAVTVHILPLFLLHFLYLRKTAVGFYLSKKLNNFTVLF